MPYFRGFQVCSRGWKSYLTGIDFLPHGDENPTPFRITGMEILPHGDKNPTLFHLFSPKDRIERRPAISCCRGNKMSNRKMFGVTLYQQGRVSSLLAFLCSCIILWFQPWVVTFAEEETDSEVWEEEVDSMADEETSGVCNGRTFYRCG